MMENPKEDTPCNCGTFSNNFLIKYEKDQIVLKNLLCAMMKKIEQLEEVQKIRESNRPSAACKPATADERPAPRPQINFVSPQMDTLQKILKSNGAYGPPPKQPVHNSRLRLRLHGLCKSKRTKDEANQYKEGGWAQRPLPHNEKKMSVKPTMATPTGNPTKPTKIMEKKLDGNADASLVSTGIKSSKVEPAPLAPFFDEMASSEDIPNPTNAPAAASFATPAAAATIEPKAETKWTVK
jgi:hypothetical protein